MYGQYEPVNENINNPFYPNMDFEIDNNNIDDNRELGFGIYGYPGYPPFYGYPGYNYGYPYYGYNHYYFPPRPNYHNGFYGYPGWYGGGYHHGGGHHDGGHHVGGHHGGGGHQWH